MSTSKAKPAKVAPTRNGASVRDLTDDNFLHVMDESDVPFESLSEEIRKEYKSRRIETRYGTWKDNRVEFVEIRAERIKTEIANLKYGISYTKDLIKYSNEPSDIPGLKRDLERWKDMLESAKNDLREISAGKIAIFEK